jgi:hypothetical protein
VPKVEIELEWLVGDRCGVPERSLVNGLAVDEPADGIRLPGGRLSMPGNGTSWRFNVSEDLNTKTGKSSRIGEIMPSENGAVS